MTVDNNSVKKALFLQQMSSSASCTSSSINECHNHFLHLASVIGKVVKSAVTIYKIGID